MSEKKSIFSKEISLKPVKARYPEKTYINLVVDEQKAKDQKAIIWFAVFLAVLAGFVKVGVYDRLDELNAAEAQYNQMAAQLTKLQEANSSYDSVKEQYDEVTDWYMTDEEKMEADKGSVFDMLDADMMPYVKLENVSISGSTITVQTGVTDLSTVSTFLKALQNDSRNGYVTVTTAAASGDETGNLVTASVVITWATSSEGGNQ
ncbi:hypothetical protein FYJ51_07660 [Erysipelotrichaceae bacterium Oil+RF-744-GAM-WT-6]|jgi:hypothetical protein|uniref:Uncharacterized protein n=1 Tax=Stecheria intestinalis TaxID=2606630 RepID=A0A7X2NSL6_9FIRM|nr:hypothetical protein [Stecheria intestinalis]MCI6746863.1 hypothetical protein [Anaerolactibacter massiliensis]MDY3234765.1 hypothetical protein [Erysipelotrichaceae bacterium]MDY4681806.1 hypothetical protein [Lachnospiraceae bacterium]MDD7681207.1 hypothetical protein [Stecheria intestinalis]MSS58782.1 hypothetical protein [Stecheria intestinalis]